MNDQTVTQSKSIAGRADHAIALNCVGIQSMLHFRIDLRTFRQTEAGVVSDRMVSFQIGRLKDRYRGLEEDCIEPMVEVEGAPRLLVQMVGIDGLVTVHRIRLAEVSRYFLLERNSS
jgi:hypothetical protein